MKIYAAFHSVSKAVMLLLCPLVFFSCEDQIDVTLDSGESLLVVDGWITDQAGPHTITLSKTAPYFHNGPAPKVSGAEVVITDDEGHIELLTENEDGKYLTSESFRGKVGGTYTLIVRAEGEEYIAVTTIRRSAVIDSLSIKYREPSMMWEEGYYVLLNAPEMEGVGDFFRFKVYRNGAFLNRPENILVAEDRMFDGSYIKDVELNFRPFDKGDHIRVETWSITAEAFQYYTAMSREIKNGGLYESPSSNIPTNVVNKNPARAGKVAGFFGGASVIYKEVTIE